MSDITEILTNSGVRTRAVEELVLGGVGKPSLEQITAQQERILSESDIDLFKDNDQPGYGAVKDIFSAFMGRGQKGFDINYNVLGQIWRGLNYVENAGGVPHEMLSAMNTGEIIALYRAFAKLIEKGKIEVKKGTYLKAEELQKMKPEEALSKMMGYGYRRTAMGSLRRKGVTYFPAQSGDLARRVTPLSQGVKDRFMDLFDLSQYKGIKIENPTTKKGKIGKEQYIDAICAHTDKLYQVNTKA